MLKRKDARMKIIDIFIAKNGERLSDGTPYVRDECDNCYILLPVSSNYFSGRNVERIARIEPDSLSKSKQQRSKGER